MRVAFLHIPKTAGQSVHHSLVKMFKQEHICPARTNKDLYKYSLTELSKYRFFSGHLDWSIIRQTGQFDFTFTVLRDPTDRILSFYFYLRKEAERISLSGSDLAPGMKAAIEWTPKDYFTGGETSIRKFIDNHYNNFYSYYFASGNYSGHSQISEKFPPGSSDLLSYAEYGLRSLTRVYTICGLERLRSDVNSILGAEIGPISEVNVNHGVPPSTRGENLTKLAGGWNWRQALDILTVTDNALFQKFSDRDSIEYLGRPND